MTKKKDVDSFLANLDSLIGGCRTLSEQSYLRILNCGFRNDSANVVAIACECVVEENPVTLRGLFYRAVSTGIFDSTSDTNYKKFGRLVTRMRRLGLVPYSWIVDSLRQTIKPSSWTGLNDFANTVRDAYRKDFWAHMPNYVHVFAEKDAIAGVIQPVTEEYDVRLSPVRGYCSESFAYEIGSLFKKINKPIKCAYLGDYDPSGFDIERDLKKKLSDFSGVDFDWVRLAVNESDFEDFGLVELNPKKSDKRYATFSKYHGESCAEVDAIPATELRYRVEAFIKKSIRANDWERLLEVEKLERESFAATLEKLGA